MSKITQKEADTSNQIALEQANNAFLLFKQFMMSNPQIEVHIWASVMCSLLVDMYVSSGISFGGFAEEWEAIKNAYEPRFKVNE